MLSNLRELLFQVVVDFRLGNVFESKLAHFN